MKTENVIIAGRELKLSQRCVKDIIDASHFQRDNTSPESSLFAYCFVIHSGLKINVDLIPKFRFIKRYFMKRRISVRRLMETLTIENIIVLSDKIISLDYGGDEKKKKGKEKIESYEAKKKLT